MSKPILVTYASRAGSTTGVAEEIARTLTEQGAQVELRPMQEITDLAPYSAVVAGSAIQRGKWLPEAMEFIEKYQDALAYKPFAAFQVCMTLSVKNEKFASIVPDWLEPVRVLVKPVCEGFFAGALDISKVPSFWDRVKFRLSVLFGVWTEGDHRNWNAIHAWAAAVKPMLEDSH